MWLVRPTACLTSRSRVVWGLNSACSKVGASTLVRIILPPSGKASRHQNPSTAELSERRPNDSWSHDDNVDLDRGLRLIRELLGFSAPRTRGATCLFRGLFGHNVQQPGKRYQRNMQEGAALAQSWRARSRRSPRFVSRVNLPSRARSCWWILDGRKWGRGSKSCWVKGR